MDTPAMYAVAGIGLCTLGWLALMLHRHLLRRLLAFNVFGSGVFLTLVGLSRDRVADDPVPEAMVLTGIVVAVASTALALVIFRRYYELTDRAEMDTPAAE